MVYCTWRNEPLFMFCFFFSKGTLTFKNGSNYEGSWEKDMREGQGKLRTQMKVKFPSCTMRFAECRRKTHCTNSFVYTNSNMYAYSLSEHREIHFTNKCGDNGYCRGKSIATMSDNFSHCQWRDNLRQSQFEGNSLHRVLARGVKDVVHLTITKYR